MRYLVLFFLIGFTTLAVGQSKPCNRSVKGKVLSRETNEPLPFATVSVQGTEIADIASENGEFEISNICQKEIDLEVRFVGYKTVVHHHDFHHPNPTIYLAANETVLESITIEDYQTEEIQSLAVQRKEINKMSITTSSLGDLANEISGVSMLKTGSNVSKPMIHGLHSNRVLVINDGLRHAYQVWGEEHAPEIDPSHVDQIEIIKGAGTVKYGPEALGGVILYNTKKPELHEELNGSVTSSYQTNGGAVGSQFNLGQGSHNFAWNVGAYGTYQGDLEAPDYTLSNTGKKEYGASFNALIHQPKFDVQISGSYFDQELGILRGSIVGNLDNLQEAIDGNKPNPTFSSTYDIGSPRQSTTHGLLKSDIKLFLGDHIVNFTYGVQQNIREEYDVRRGTLNERPVIDLKLISHTLEAEWVQASKNRWNGSSGIQVYTQNSVNEPESNPANFVPDYDVINIGAYTIQSYHFEKVTLELGARFDYQSLSVADTIREIYTYSNDLDFNNASFTLGFRKKLNPNTTVFTNLGTAWRPPNVAELYSWGYHNSRIQFGLWRYDFTPDVVTPPNSVFDESSRSVPAENSYKIISGIEIDKTKLKAEFVVFTNKINNYIFLRPYGITTNIAGTIPYWLFEQTDALFLGSDWDIRYTHSDRFTSEVKLSYVYAKSTEKDQPLLEIPPLNIDYSLEYKNSFWTLGLNLNYIARQWNEPLVIEPREIENGNTEVDRNTDIFDYMAPPDGYFLIGTKIGFEKKKWSAEINVRNILNSRYRIYTDRLRYFADAPGRNIGFSLQYSF
ncbi:TonB-dependent receptor [Fulvivirga sp. RKSG066]|uniref:TonB-dependent receptor n=1 Tax=Fulvivirga aurantia TaxID=2529383 RepID=UPI0012BB7258|nr:TonB-dependent receptor [Fulvivirga aurantia]MTI21732.1 TonB-dependent receptor [Fulvivirga aurantia]